MGSKGFIMINSASTLVPKWALSSNPLPIGLGPFNVSLSSSWKKSCSSSRALPFVVRAEQHDQHDSGALPYAPIPSGSAGRVHSAYTITEDEQEMKLVLDMPGVPAGDVDVKVEGDTLAIKDMGRQLYSPYDTMFQLPPYIEKQDIAATLINGVLHVSMPKKAILVPVKTPPLVEKETQGKEGSTGMENVALPSIELNEWLNRTAFLDFPNYVRTPWGQIEDGKVVKVSMDVPGLSANDIMVCIMGDLLVIDDQGNATKLDDLGRKIPGCHAKLQLPEGCIRDQAFAVLKSGILYITVPKLSSVDSIIPVDVPVRSD